MGILSYKDKQFYLDGKPYVVLSGAIHYFRVPREYWYDRLLKLKECGFNTVETYACWNLHEKNEGEFDFSGILDVEAYIETAESLGLHVILRPGPYICAEWDFGGLPAWLLKYENMALRCYDERYLGFVKRYFKELFSHIRPHLAVNGGSVFMLQIENEYGSYGNDKEYLRAIVDIYKELDMDCLLFTADGSSTAMQSGGSLEGYLPTANFGSDPKGSFARFQVSHPNVPLMCTEFWSGWFDHWGEEHHVRPAEQIVSCVKDFAELGASFNFYMFHGGTNFGFLNGANHPGYYAPTVTSYDYGAPLSEAGDRTENYYKLREILEAKYGKAPEMTAKETEKAAYGELKLTEQALLFDNLDKLSAPVHVSEPKYMEEIGQSFGYVLYRTTLKGPRDKQAIKASAVNDRAILFVNGEKKDVWERWNMKHMGEEPTVFDLAKDEEAKLDILVENMGRVNYGPELCDRKGLRDVRFEIQKACYQFHFGWDMYALPMDDLSPLEYTPVSDGAITAPVFLRGNLVLKDTPKDTFIRLDGFTKGFVTVNGINLGRYFNSAGPQKTLYLPAPFLKVGDNEIIVFESDGAKKPVITLCDKPELE